MKLRILGCGTSTGVPKIGGDWGKCDPREPRNRRLRSSILVETGGARLLIDCGPDLRQQLLEAEVGTLDAVLITHDHGDHVHGIDDLRPVARACGRPMPIHARAATLASLQQRFAYAFERSSFYPPIGDLQAIAEEWSLGRARIRVVDQPHGDGTALGVRIDEGEHSAVYATDFNALSEDMATLYQGADVWVADCLTRRPHPSHAHLDAVLGWARELRIGHLYLTHMGNGLDYRTLAAELPDWAEPAYDGMEIDL